MKTSMKPINDKVDPIRDPRLEDSSLQEKVSNRVNELLTVLDRDILYIQDSLSALNELRSLVIKRDDAALSELLQKIQSKKDNYAANDSQRRSIQKDLAEAFSCSVEQMTLSALEFTLQGEQKAQVAKIKAKLKDLIKELKKEHLSTTLLLSDCIRFNNLFLKAIFDFGKNKKIMYGPSGQTKRQIDTTLIAFSV
jgi:hypothetical protein